jgi:hypothetical protein
LRRRTSDRGLAHTPSRDRGHCSVHDHRRAPRCGNRHGGPQRGPGRRWRRGSFRRRALAGISAVASRLLAGSGPARNCGSSRHRKARVTLSLPRGRSRQAPARRIDAPTRLRRSGSGTPQFARAQLHRALGPANDARSSRCLPSVHLRQPGAPSAPHAQSCWPVRGGRGGSPGQHRSQGRVAARVGPGAQRLRRSR